MHWFARGGGCGWVRLGLASTAEECCPMMARRGERGGDGEWEGMGGQAQDPVHLAAIGLMGDLGEVDLRIANLGFSGCTRTGNEAANGLSVLCVHGSFPPL